MECIMSKSTWLQNFCLGLISVLNHSIRLFQEDSTSNLSNFMEGWVLTICTANKTMQNDAKTATRKFTMRHEFALSLQKLLHYQIYQQVGNWQSRIFFSSNYFFFVRNSFTFYVKKFVKISFFVSKFAKTSMSSSNQYWWTKIHINKLLTNFFTVFDIFKEFFFCKICTPSINELSSILHHWIQFSSLDWLANNQLIGNN